MSEGFGGLDSQAEVSAPERGEGSGLHNSQPVSRDDFEAALAQAITAELEDGGADLPYSVVAERVAARTVDAVVSRWDDEDSAAYEIGFQDGREQAIQTLDVATGGDGEYVASTVPGEGCPTPDHMLARIVERVQHVCQMLEDIRYEVECTHDGYRRNGPEWTSRSTGQEYYSASFVLEKLSDIDAKAIVALGALSPNGAAPSGFMRTWDAEKKIWVRPAGEKSQ